MSAAVWTTSARAFDMSCPPAIGPDQSLTESPAGWRAWTDNRNAPSVWENVEFYSGPPEQGAALVPNNDGAREPPSWAWGAKPSHPIWQVCVYSDTTVKLARPLPPGLKGCRLAYTALNANARPVPAKVDCQ